MIGRTVLVSRPAEAQTYKIDSGMPGYSISYGLPDDFCWFNHLTVNGTVTLTSIEAILGDTPDGTPDFNHRPISKSPFAMSQPKPFCCAAKSTP